MMIQLIKLARLELRTCVLVFFIAFRTSNIKYPYGRHLVHYIIYFPFAFCFIVLNGEMVHVESLKSVSS